MYGNFENLPLVEDSSSTTEDLLAFYLQFCNRFPSVLSTVREGFGANTYSGSSRRNKTFPVGLTRGSSMVFKLMSMMLLMMMVMMVMMMMLNQTVWSFVVAIPGLGKLNTCAASVSPIPHASLNQQ